MTSHELAADLRKLAEKFEQAETFECGSSVPLFQFHAWNKKEFAALVKVLKGAKISKPDDYFLEVENRIGAVRTIVMIGRSEVCHKVKKLKEVEVWECDPILTPEEESEVVGG